MSNHKIPQFGDREMDVSSLSNTERAIERFNSWGDWTGTEPWLTTTAKELNKRYRDLRKDIRENTDYWSHSQYCERLAFHYYNLACYCNCELFNKHQLHLGIVKKYLEKSLEKFTGVARDDYSDEVTLLNEDAERFSAEVNEAYARLEKQLTRYRNCDTEKYMNLCTVLGCFDRIPLQSCSTDNNRKRMLNIELLTVIDILEHALSVPDYKNTLIVTEQCHYLSEAYRLAGSHALSARYNRIRDDLKNRLLNATVESCDNRQGIKNIIAEELQLYKSDLTGVKNFIEETFGTSLSANDVAYIEQKYIKYCARFWLLETRDFLNKLTESKNGTLIQEIFNSLYEVRGLSQIPYPLNRLDYYTLLIDHVKSLTKEDESIFLNRFKKDCLEHTVAYTDNANNELELLLTIVDLLSSERYRWIVAEIELDDFCQGYLSLDELFDNIMKLPENFHGKTLAVVQQATEILKGQLFLIDKFKQVLGDYIKPVEIRELRIDNRWIVRVMAKNIVVSDILRELENKISENPKIEEVRFVDADIVHIDADLDSEIWRGTNLVISTKAIKVHGPVTWNVSGKDNRTVYSDCAGTSDDGCGKRGKDGYAGESGGNVLILVEIMENPENLTIFSNGGEGSKGQDGGNGSHGKEGEGITKEEFTKRFPPVAINEEFKRERIVSDTINNVKHDLKEVKTEWYEDRYVANLPISLNSICKKNIFLNTITNHGNEVIFSYYCGGGLSLGLHAFLLYKGSSGLPGERGGECGLGGEGGYPGLISVKHPESNEEFAIIKQVKTGKQGAKGQGGLYGNHGKNGWDIGYMDYNIKLFAKEYWPQYFGENQNYKIKLNYYSESSSSRLLCPYEEHLGRMEIYAQMEYQTIEHNKVRRYEQRTTASHDCERQQHARAVRKKNVSQSSVLAVSRHRSSSVLHDS